MSSENFLDLLVEAYRRLEVEDTDLKFSFTRGPADYAKPSAWLEVEATYRAGQVTVWSSGECDTQVSDSQSERTNVLLLRHPEDLREVVQEVIDACTATPIPRSS